MLSCNREQFYNHRSILPGINLQNESHGSLALLLNLLKVDLPINRCSNLSKLGVGGGEVNFSKNSKKFTKMQFKFN